MRWELFFLVGVLMLSLVSALPNQADNKITFNYPTATPPVNYSLVEVNSSDFWDFLDTPADITYDDILGGDVEAAGYTGYFSYIFGTDGSLDINGDPWYLGGADLEIDQDLQVNNTYVEHDIMPTNTLTGNIGSGALRWLTLWVQNISAEYMSVYNIDASENVTAAYFNGDGSYLTGIGSYNSTYDLWAYNQTLPETDPIFTQANTSIWVGINSKGTGNASTGFCPAGSFAVNITGTTVQCQASAGGGGNPFNQNLNTTDTPTFANITDSGLTSGRITFAGASGLLSDSANFLFNSGTNLLTLTGSQYVNVNSTTAFKVEQDGVADNVLVVDTSNFGSDSAGVRTGTAGLWSGTTAADIYSWIYFKPPAFGNESTTGTGQYGRGVTINSQAGGQTTAVVVTGRGGEGGGFNLGGGVGAIAPVSATGVAYGGAGGGTTLQSGTGGDAIAGTSETIFYFGGAGGSTLLYGGTGGRVKYGQTASQAGAGGSVNLVAGSGGVALAGGSKAIKGGNAGSIYIDVGAVGAGAVGGASGTAGTINLGYVKRASNMYVSGQTTTNLFTFDLTNENFNTIKDNAKHQFGAASDAMLTFTGTQFQIQSDLVTATDSLLLRGGTNGILFNISNSQIASINQTGLSVTGNITSTGIYKVGNQNGITGSFSMLNSTSNQCDMNFTGGILTASNC